jgi:hypothetical protein
MDNSFEKNNMLKEFYIPTYIFMPESSVEQVPQIPSCPVIVFINTKSGGQLGHDLIVSYRKLLNHAQVHTFKVTIYILVHYSAPLHFYCRSKYMDLGVVLNF